MRSKAIVAFEPEPKGSVGPNLKFEDVETAELREGEVLVEIVASGVCHTDVVITSGVAGPEATTFPKVAGHEGSGYVRALGPNVSSLAVGDPVLLSFHYCNNCGSCKRQHPAYCASFPPLNYAGDPGRFKIVSKDNQECYGKFFGQSSFAHYSVVAENSCLNARKLLRSDDELKLFAPLGCGMQTGAGAIINIAQARDHDRVLVIGLGGVGMAAVMAAKVIGCKEIIAMDRAVNRLEIAKEIGATRIIDTNKTPDFPAELRNIDPDLASVVIDTTGVPKLIETAHQQCLSTRGKLVIIGIMPPDFTITVPALNMLSTGQAIMGCIEGDSIPHEMIPQMISWYREGKFPIEKLVKYIPAENFPQALSEMHSGETIKPVLLWT